MPTFPSVIDLSTAGASTIVIGADDNDKAGWSVSEAGDVNGDGFADFILSARYASNGSVDSGVAYVIFGKAGGLSNIDLQNPLAAATGFAINGVAASDATGFSVAGGGDYNGDGFDDLVIGVPYATARPGALDEAAAAGKVYVVFGKASGFGAIDLGGADAADDFIVIQGDNPIDRLGTSVSFAGDVDGDGFDDLILGAPKGDSAGYNDGQAYVIFGQAAGTETDLDLGAALAASRGYLIAVSTTSTYDQFGQSVSGAGDINGDGFDDFIVGAPQATFGGESTGTAYVVFGTDGGFAGISEGVFNASAPEYDPLIGFAIHGDAGNDGAGRSVSGAGDVNGDGFADIVIGIDGGDDGGNTAGEAYVLFGKASGFNEVDLSNPLAAADGFHIIGSAEFDFLGASVSSAGDVNGDGFDDVIVGAPSEDKTADANFNSGAAYVIFGKASGFTTINLDTPLNGDNGFMIVGDATQDKAGFSVSSAGDVNGDGFDDVLVGAPYGDDGATFGYSGETYLIYGIAPTTAVNRTGTAASQTLAGGALNDTLSGLGGVDLLFGNGGNDTMDGGAGADVMKGGLGNDTYFVDNAGDVVIELAGGGRDKIYANLGLTLGAEIEDLTLQAVAGAATGTGNGLANLINGNASNNTLSGLGGIDTLFGNGGNDTLSGGLDNDLLFGGDGNDIMDGGGGADDMTGGIGDDTYFADTALDDAIEVAGQGRDKVYANSGFTLDANVEDLTLQAVAGAATGTGNDDNNLINGNESGNTLSGLAGVDTLVGNGGNDTLLGGLGNDLLFGGASNDAMDGGAGDDDMTGGIGDDTYFADSIGDDAIELAGQGRDKVYANSSFTLDANVEDLTLQTAAGAATGTGNGDNNVINGNASANTLNGLGGTDTLIGGAGIDTLDGGLANDIMDGGADADNFRFTTALGGNVDTILGFQVGSDKIVLENAVFTGLAAGALAAGAFNTGSAATQADDRIIYNNATGALLFDVDGVGGAAAVQFATLSGAPAIGAGDFTVI